MQNQTTNTSNTFAKTIGKVTYNVQVHFSQTSNQTFEGRLLRVIKSEAEKIWKPP